MTPVEACRRANSVSKSISILAELRHAILARPEFDTTDNLTVWSENGAGRSVPTIYSLSERGAVLIESMTGHRPARVSRGHPECSASFRVARVCSPSMRRTFLPPHQTIQQRRWRLYDGLL